MGGAAGSMNGGGGAAGAVGVAGAAGTAGTGGASSLCAPLAQLDFENDLDDAYGLANVGTARDFVIFQPGRVGMAARSSHNDDDGGDDFTIELGEVFAQVDELTVHFWVNYAEEYENCDPNEIYNIKLFWTLGRRPTTR